MLRAEQGEQQPASSGGAGVPAPAAAPSVAEQYGAALDAAELEARHTLDFGHAQPSSQQLVFAGLEPDQRRGRRVREAVQMHRVRCACRGPLCGASRWLQRCVRVFRGSAHRGAP